MIIVEPSAISNSVPTDVYHSVGTNSSKYTYATLDFPGVEIPSKKYNTNDKLTFFERIRPR
jgi:hypothetical protein